jgi:hypothetical protein
MPLDWLFDILCARGRRVHRMARSRQSSGGDLSHSPQGSGWTREAGGRKTCKFTSMDQLRSFLPRGDQIQRVGPKPAGQGK